MLNRLILIVLTKSLILSSVSGISQNIPKFGKVSLEELQMEHYPEDTTAGAVVLFDIGKFGGNDLKFNRHLRVKILKKSGLDWGNWVFNTPSKGDFKVEVSNLEKGEIVKEKTDKNSIYIEEVIDGYTVYKVFAPNVKVGSVIDITYSHFGLPFEWRFQERIPIIYSNLQVYNSSRVSYKKAFYGLETVESISPYEWCARSMPAFKIEPYLNHYSNYITKIQFQVEVIDFGYSKAYLSSSWKMIIDNLLRSENFGSQLTDSPFLKDYAKVIKEKDLSTHEMIREALDLVRQNIKWDGVKSVYNFGDTKKIFTTSHSGNSAEINLTLINLLNKIGIKTYPIVLSTRENGILQPHSPAIDQINYVVGYVQFEGIELLLDATSENLSPGILPEYCLNGVGLLVKEDTEQWINLNDKHVDRKKQFINIKLNNDGTSFCEVTQNFYEYGFLKWVEIVKENNYDEDILLNYYKKRFPKTVVLDYAIKKKDPEALTGQEVIDVDLSDNLIDAGDEYIFNPYVLFEYLENPFKSNERKYPVDLGCPKDVDLTAIIQLPPGVRIKEIPSSQKLTTPDSGATFIFLANSNDSSIQLRVKLTLHRAVYTETEYLELRQFFSEALKILNTPIQLAKT